MATTLIRYQFMIKSYFLDSKRICIEASENESFIIGFLSDYNFVVSEQMGYSFTDEIITPLVEQYYNGNFEEIIEKIDKYLLFNRFNTIAWHISCKSEERIRIGKRIKELRLEKNMEAKELAQLAGIDSANLCRIEQGRYSVGLDVLCKIAGVLKKKIDFISK